MFSLSKQTVELIEKEIRPRLWELNCEEHRLESGALVIDMGINTPGSWEAGIQAPPPSSSVAMGKLANLACLRVPMCTMGPMAPASEDGHE